MDNEEVPPLHHLNSNNLKRSRMQEGCDNIPKRQLVGGIDDTQITNGVILAFGKRFYLCNDMLNDITYAYRFSGRNREGLPDDSMLVVFTAKPTMKEYPYRFYISMNIRDRWGFIEINDHMEKVGVPTEPYVLCGNVTRLITELTNISQQFLYYVHVYYAPRIAVQSF